MRLLLMFVLVGAASAREEGWHPIVPEPSLTYTTYVKSPERSLESSPHLKIVNRRPSIPYSSSKLSGAYSSGPQPDSDTCSVYKVSMNQELFYQYLEYEKDLPDLKEFTLCMWSKFHNHSEDHPLFSYSVGDSPKEISAWISNTVEASYFSMAVHGQTFFRLNYPLKLNTWYHSCQSWNGKTGEWQIWVNAERVGRGFHNRLVGHVIKGSGVAVTGQEQSLLYSKDGLEPTIKLSGLMGEVTMLQLYHVALTAGKAHKDHKHHHAHHFKHDGSPLEASTEAATEPPPPEATPLGNGNFLIGGQLQRAPNLNLAGAQQQQMIPVQLPNGLQLQQGYINGQLSNRIVSEQLLNSVHQIPSAQPSLNPIPQIALSDLSLPSSIGYSQRFSLRQPLGPSKSSTVMLSGSLLNPANVQYIDDTSSHNLYKRDSKKRDKRDNPEKELESSPPGKKDKRGLVALSDGSIVDEALLSPNIAADDEDAMFQQSLLSGLAGVVGNVPVQNLQKETEKYEKRLAWGGLPARVSQDGRDIPSSSLALCSLSSGLIRKRRIAQESSRVCRGHLVKAVQVDEREPAEAEVKAVMQMCSGCAPEPFKKALVLSWRATPKKLHSGAHYYKGLPICKAF